MVLVIFEEEIEGKCENEGRIECERTSNEVMNGKSGIEMELMKTFFCRLIV